MTQNILTWCKSVASLTPAHDLNHLVQAERAIMQPFIQGSGRFAVNYTDHAVKTNSQ